MAAYMRNQFAFLGIQSVARRQRSMPILRALKKQRRAIDWDFVEECWSADEREFQYVAVDYIRLFSDGRFLKVDELAHLERLVTAKSWWDTVDPLAKAYGSVFRGTSTADHSTVVSAATHESMWMRRVAILHQLGFRADTSVEILTSVIQPNLRDDEFFINKAIGWALRDYAYTDADWVLSYVERHQGSMSSLSVREALKNVGGRKGD